MAPRGHHLLDLADGACRVQILWASFRAIHDRVATIQAERILELIKPITRSFVATIDDPTIGGQ
jgi:hypothetical protein